MHCCIANTDTASTWRTAGRCVLPSGTLCRLTGFVYIAALADRPQAGKICKAAPKLLHWGCKLSLAGLKQLGTNDNPDDAWCSFACLRPDPPKARPKVLGSVVGSCSCEDQLDS